MADTILKFPYFRKPFAASWSGLSSLRCVQSQTPVPRFWEVPAQRSAQVCCMGDSEQGQRLVTPDRSPWISINAESARPLREWGRGRRGGWRDAFPAFPGPTRTGMRPDATDIWPFSPDKDAPRASFANFSAKLNGSPSRRVTFLE